MKRHQHFFSVVLLSSSLLTIFFLSYSYHHSLGWTIWKIFRWESVATFLDPNDEQLLFAIGDYSFGHGKYDIDQARRYLEKALALNPHNLDARYQYARINFLQGQFKTAIGNLNIVLTENQDFSKAYYMRGLVFGYMELPSLAIENFQEFIRRDPINWAGYNDLAWIYFKKGDYEKTKETAENGLKQAPNNPWLNNIHGTALLNLGEKEAAKDAFRIALEKTDKMTSESWGSAYPGNDPRIYAQGLNEMRESIRKNLQLVE